MRSAKPHAESGIPVTESLTELEVTRMLARWNDGESAALDELMPAVYQELQRLARRTMRGERSDHTLESTALVHEAFVRFTSGAAVSFQDRKHFFTLMARLMRRILVDHARGRHATRRGGAQQRVPLDDLKLSSAPTERGLLLLSRALDTLHELDSRKAKVIELRFFGGLDVKQTAEILDISAPTVIADTRFARAWMYDWMRDQASWAQDSSVQPSRRPAESL